MAMMDHARKKAGDNGRSAGVGRNKVSTTLLLTFVAMEASSPKDETAPEAVRSGPPLYTRHAGVLAQSCH